MKTPSNYAIQRLDQGASDMEVRHLGISDEDRLRTKIMNAVSVLCERLVREGLSRISRTVDDGLNAQRQEFERQLATQREWFERQLSELRAQMDGIPIVDKEKVRGWIERTPEELLIDELCRQYKACGGRKWEDFKTILLNANTKYRGRDMSLLERIRSFEKPVIFFLKEHHSGEHTVLVSDGVPSDSVVGKDDLSGIGALDIDISTGGKVVYRLFNYEEIDKWNECTNLPFLWSDRSWSAIQEHSTFTPVLGYSYYRYVRGCSADLGRRSEPSREDSLLRHDRYLLEIKWRSNTNSQYKSYK